MELTKSYIKCLNRNSLIEYLSEQEFGKEAELLEARDIDGERFLNFTELDLAQWRLTPNQKKVLLSCRNKILTKPSLPPLPKPIARKWSNISFKKEKVRHDLCAKSSEGSLGSNTNGKMATINPRRSLPFLSKDTNSDSETNEGEVYDVPRRHVSRKVLPVQSKHSNHNFNKVAAKYVDKRLPPLPKGTNCNELTSECSEKPLPLMSNDPGINANRHNDRPEVSVQRSLSPISKPMFPEVDVNEVYDEPKKLFPVLHKESPCNMDKNVVEDRKDLKTFGYQQKPVTPKEEIIYKVPKPPRRVHFQNSLPVQTQQPYLKYDEQKNVEKQQKVLSTPQEDIDQQLDINIEENYDIPKSFIRQSVQYVDMTQAKSVSLENLANSPDYVVMNQQPNFAEQSFPTRMPPPIPPRRPFSSNENDPYLKESIQKTLSPTAEIQSKHETLEKEETEGYLEPNSITASSMEFSSNRGFVNNERLVPPPPSKLQLNFNQDDDLHLKRSGGNNVTNLGKQSQKLPVPKFKSFEVEEIGEYLEPNSIDSFVMEIPYCTNSLSHHDATPLRQKLNTENSIKGSIRNRPLPPIPVETDDFRSITPPPAPNKFNMPIRKNEFSTIPDHPRPAPPKYFSNTNYDKVLGNWNECVFPPPPPPLESTDLDANFDINELLPPPPPPEFLDTLTNAVNLKKKEESELPRPPKFNNLYDIHQISTLHKLIQEDDFSSSEEDSFNLNNCPFYRNTDRKGARQMLSKMKNLGNGAFLIRPSTNGSYFVGLTVYHDDYFYNLGVHRDTDDKFYCESLNNREIEKFDQLIDFIYHYKYNPLTIKKRDGTLLHLYLKHSLPNDIF